MGSLNLWLGSAVEGQCYRTESLTCGVCTDSGLLVSELNYRTPSWCSEHWRIDGCGRKTTHLVLEMLWVVPHPHPHNSQLLLIPPKHFINLVFLFYFLSLQPLYPASILYHLSAGLCTVNINSHAHRLSPLERVFSPSRLILSCVWIIPLIL